jgi:hypothetical protein
MLSLEVNGYSRYQFIENVAKDNIYALGIKSFNEFDHTLAVPFSATHDGTGYWYCDVVSYDAARPVYHGFVFYHVNGSATRNNFQLGYLDQFKKYLINMAVNYDKITYGYTGVGDMPAAINLPLNENFQLQNTGVNDLSLAGSPAYDFRHSIYFLHSNDPKIYAAWNIYSPGLGFKMLSFPKELTDVYSFLNVEGFDHSSTTFIRGQGYENFLDVTYKGTVRGEYEEYSVSIED